MKEAEERKKMTPEMKMMKELMGSIAEIKSGIAKYTWESKQHILNPPDARGGKSTGALCALRSRSVILT